MKAVISEPLWLAPRGIRTLVHRRVCYGRENMTNTVTATRPEAVSASELTSCLARSEKEALTSDWMGFGGHDTRR